MNSHGIFSMAQKSGQAFWNRFADRYAARQIKDVAAYEAMLADAASRLRPGDHVLEIGSGTGGTAIRLAASVACYVATDFSAEMIRIARAKQSPANLRFELSAAGDLPAGGPFDAVCAFNVLHLLDDLPATLAHLHGQLKPGGLLISKTWCFAELPLALRALFATLRTFGLFPAAASLTGEQLRCAIRETGFAIEDERVFGSRPQNVYIVAHRA
jgi:cyclopropane fatty-acyl-phospholipid synthase-like methyltransferase